MRMRVSPSLSWPPPGFCAAEQLLPWNPLKYSHTDPGTHMRHGSSLREDPDRHLCGDQAQWWWVTPSSRSFIRLRRCSLSAHHLCLTPGKAVKHKTASANDGRGSIQTNAYISNTLCPWHAVVLHVFGMHAPANPLANLLILLWLRFDS